MLHPNVVLRKSSIEGKGLFAKKKIPKGTILWRFKDDRVYAPEQCEKFSKKYKAMLRRYAYADIDGKLVYCTDNAKHWNHSCDPNSAPLNREMDIAVKDIETGEELTYDYALLLSKTGKLRCNCNSENCRGTIKREPPNSKIVHKLGALAKEASKNLSKVKQPLLQDTECKVKGV